VLASGQWYKISVLAAGVYKVDLPLLNKLGVNTANLSSASIRLFGNGGRMLPKPATAPIPTTCWKTPSRWSMAAMVFLMGTTISCFTPPAPTTGLKTQLTISLYIKEFI